MRPSIRGGQIFFLIKEFLLKNHKKNLKNFALTDNIKKSVDWLKNLYDSMLLEKIFQEDVNGHDTPPLPINPSENKKISDMVADLNTVLDKALPP